MSHPSPILPAERQPRRFLLDRRGEVAIEYGLIVCLVVIAIVASLTQFNGATKILYNKISNAMVGTP